MLQITPQVEAVIAQVPLWNGKRVAVEPMPDVVNLNNASYRVTADGEAFVLRLASDNAPLSVDRAVEREAIFAASRAGLAPELLHFGAGGHMVTRFVAGRHLTPDEACEPDNIARIGDALRRLHAIQTVTGDGSVFRRIETLANNARALGAELPPDWSELQDKLRRIEAARQADARVRYGLCHGDFWLNNFLDDGERLWLVDWEFGGHGDGGFDLATICLGARYSPAQTALLLEAYGDERPDDLEIVETMKPIVFGFEAVWSAVQGVRLGASAYDYPNHARVMFDRLRASIR